MPKSTEPLTPAQVYRFAVAFCQPRLAFRSVGKVTSEVLVTVLFAAAARIFLHLRDLPPPQGRTLRGDLCQRPVRQPLLPRGAQAQGQRRLRRPPAQAVAPTAQAAAPPRRRPDPLALLRPALPGEPRDLPLPGQARDQLVLRLRHRLLGPPGPAVHLGRDSRDALGVPQGGTPGVAAPGEQGGLKPGLLLLDRGFYSVAVIRYLQRARWPFLMPVVCHGRKADHPKGPSGSNVFKQEKKSGWFRHTLKDGKKDKATVWICVKRARWVDRHRRRKSDTWVYAYWGITPRRVDWVKETYRKRFGIETSYRQMNQCRIRTTTKKFNVRFLYVVIGLLLRNLWVWLHHFVLSSPRRGGRRYNWDLLRVERMLLWLKPMTETMYGLVDTIATERDMPELVPS